MRDEIELPAAGRQPGELEAAIGGDAGVDPGADPAPIGLRRAGEGGDDARAGEPCRESRRETRQRCRLRRREPPAQAAAGDHVDVDREIARIEPDLVRIAEGRDASLVGGGRPRRHGVRPACRPPAAASRARGRRSPRARPGRSSRSRPARRAAGRASRSPCGGERSRPNRPPRSRRPRARGRSRPLRIAPRRERRSSPTASARILSASTSLRSTAVHGAGLPCRASRRVTTRSRAVAPAVLPSPRASARGRLRPRAHAVRCAPAGSRSRRSNHSFRHRPPP